MQNYINASLNITSGPRKLHQLTKEELGEFWVSEHSQFKEQRWRYTVSTPGTRDGVGTINWGMTLYDGSVLTDPQHADRLHWARVLLLTLIFLPCDGRPVEAGSMSGYQQSFKWILSWMSEKTIFLPMEFDASLIAEFQEDIARYILDNSEDDEVSPAAVRRAFQILADLWAQRSAMERMGIRSISVDPLYKTSVAALAEAISGKAIGWIKPLPDEVAIPIFNAALDFMEDPANDILALMKAHHPLQGEAKTTRTARIGAILRNFEFSRRTGQPRPWHPKLRSRELLSRYAGRAKKIAHFSAFRRLAFDLVGACSIIAQGLSGMRISELCGMQAGIDCVTGLPKSVRLEQSQSGLHEYFVVRSILKKGLEGPPREVDWVLGMRPLGSSVIPPAVKALLILNRLFEIWHPNALNGNLILQWGGHLAMAHPSAELDPISSDRLRNAMKDFVERWVDLSMLPDNAKNKTAENELVPWRVSKGRVFSTHMLRKTWASYTLATNPLLLGAIQMQFHHLSHAITDSGYIGNNPVSVEALDSVGRQRRNSMLLEMVTGKARLGGRMGRALEHATSELKKAIEGLSTSEQWRRVGEWADLNQLKFHFSNHATCCAIRKSEMRCHDAAGTPTWIRHEPNFQMREPGLCAGCSSGIMDYSHEPFWSERYVSNKVSERQGELLGLEREFRVIKERSIQAGKVLLSFGVNLHELDLTVEKKLKEANA